MAKGGRRARRAPGPQNIPSGVTVGVQEPASEATSTSRKVPSTSSKTPPTSKRGIKSSQKPCFDLQLKGRCERRAECPYRHDIQANEQTPLLAAKNTAPLPPQALHAKGRTGSKNDPQSSAKDVERAQAESRNAAAAVSQRMILGSIVTFTAGLHVASFISGFELCVVHIHGLPADAREKEILQLFTKQGIPSTSLQLTSNRGLASGEREAKVVLPSELGQTLAVKLESLKFRDRSLSFDVKPYHIAGAMGSQTKNEHVVTFSWPSPSQCFVVTCLEPHRASELLKKLNGHVHSQRCWRATLDEYTGGRARPVTPGAIKVENVSPSDSMLDVTSVASASSIPVSCRALPPRGPPAGTAPRELIRGLVQLSECPASDVVGVEEDVSDAIRGHSKVRVTFRHREDAVRALSYIERNPPFPKPQIRMNLPTSLSFVLTVPLEQYDVQKSQWEHLERTFGKSTGCYLSKVPSGTKPVVRLRVGGSDEKAVGLLKLRVERLSRGVKLPIWHSQFAWPCKAVTELTERVRTDCGALIHMNWRDRQVKAFGDDEAIRQARAIVEAEITRLDAREKHTLVPPSSIHYLLHHGLDQLRELLGDEHALKYNHRTRTLASSGDEETQRIVRRVLEDASSRPTKRRAASEKTCPICFDELTAAVRLGCDHSYCANCLRHFLTSAVDSTKFPLLCFGNEAKCETPIAISVIEEFLSPPQFSKLLETAFRTYVSEHNTDIRYCQTPDCDQIYRAVPGTAIGAHPFPLRCPACLASVCPECHDVGHVGVSCAEHRARNTPAEQDRQLNEWIASQGGAVQQCPSCRIPIQKAGGCNHITCRCGAHVCWRCRGTFSKETIYQHMRDVHGGSGGWNGDDVAPPTPIVRTRAPLAAPPTPPVTVHPVPPRAVIPPWVPHTPLPRFVPAPRVPAPPPALRPSATIPAPPHTPLSAPLPWPIVTPQPPMFNYLPHPPQRTVATGVPRFQAERVPVPMTLPRAPEPVVPVQATHRPHAVQRPDVETSLPLPVTARRSPPNNGGDALFGLLVIGFFVWLLWDDSK